MNEEEEEEEGRFGEKYIFTKAFQQLGYIFDV